ncbi:ATP-binding protein [Methanococcus maripaludis]|uniref:Putative HTH transcriptional regulator n=1 Tax=Methanococcus maripaludis TaxID=39152 RepID=A0A7J9SA02_METMI|nr:ATP-binding protein [Methanococcus maripaludis]MBB6495999.1 putative HTH transcriptional regulator [Methanococcus maripaludis]
MIIEDLGTGLSKARNPAIADIFKEAGYIERWGSGFNKIFSECEKAGLKKPEIIESSYLKVRFYRPVVSDREIPGDTKSYREIPRDTKSYREIPGDTKSYRTIVDDTLTQDMDIQYAAILKYVTEKGHIASKEVESLLSLKKTRAQEILKEMVEKNILEQKGKARATKYILKIK